MNKTYLAIGIVLLAIIAGVIFVLSQSETELVPTKPIDTVTSSATTTATTEEGESNDIELDLSKLQGKDRLYTEEEGKYENLSEEERRLLIKVRCTIDQKNNERYTDSYRLCNAQTVNTRHDKLVSLRNGIGVTYTAGEGQPKGRLYIYDLAEQEPIKDFIDYGNFVFGSNLIVHEETLSEDTQQLELYRPGMRTFVDIPYSLVNGSDYLNSSDPILREFTIEFSGETIITYLHTYKNCVDIGGEIAPRLMKCEVASETPVSFDLSNLP